MHWSHLNFSCLVQLNSADNSLFLQDYDVFCDKLSSFFPVFIFVAGGYRSVSWTLYTRGMYVWTTKTHSLTQQNTQWNCQTRAIFRRTLFLPRFWGLLLSTQPIVGWWWSDLILMRQQSMRINVVLHLFIHNIFFFILTIVSLLSLPMILKYNYKRSAYRSSSLHSFVWLRYDLHGWMKERAKKCCCDDSDKNYYDFNANDEVFLSFFLYYKPLQHTQLYCAEKSLRMKIDLTIWSRESSDCDVC